MNAPVTILFRAHGPQTFDDNFYRLLAKHDILVMEYNTRDDRLGVYEGDFMKLSQGDITPETMLATYPQGDLALFRVFYNSRKELVLERSPVTESEFVDYSNLDSLAYDMAQRPDRINAINCKWRALMKFADMNARRDVSLAEQVTKLHEANPTKKILIYRGLGHRRKLLAELSAKGVICEVLGDESRDLESQLIERLANGESISAADVLRTLGLWQFDTE